MTNSHSILNRPIAGPDGLPDPFAPAPIAVPALDAVVAFAPHPADDAPVAVYEIPSRVAVRGELFSFRIPDGTFTDSDSPLTYTVMQRLGGDLPSWLTFDSDSQMFQGTVPDASVDGNLDYDLKVTASDGTNSVSEFFDLHLRDTDDPPIANAITDQTIAEDTAFNYQLDPSAFTAVYGLVYHASLAGHMALPSWLHFNPATQTFSGTPPLNFNGTLQIVITADDGSRAIDNSFLLHITPVEDAPVIDEPLQDRTALENAPFTIVIPDGVFSDPDVNDVLDIIATRTNGKPLPGWLMFDPDTMTFTGTPPPNFTGTIKLMLTATDGYQSVSDIFKLDVWSIDQPPVLNKAIKDDHIKAGTAFTYQVPHNSFTDADNPKLSYSATLENGGKLPSWLHFNATTQTFSGTAPDGFKGVIAVTVTASDNVSTASGTFQFTAGPPVMSNPIPDQSLGAHRAWSFTIPHDTFTTFRPVALTYTAALSNGNPLPSWLTFDPASQTLSGTAPTGFTGNLKVKITASDGTHSASDTFNLADDGDFSYHITGSVWGRSAPSEIHYRFDKLYFQSSNSWDASFNEGFSSGPLYGGISGGAGASYNVQAGLLADLTLKPDQFDLRESFDINEHTSGAVLNTNPFVDVTGILTGHNSFHLMAPDDAFELQAFVGITATASAFLSGGIYGGFATPDINLGFKTIDIPDITFDAGFNQNIDLPGIEKIDISGGKITKPDGDIGAIEADIKSGDDPFNLDLDDDGIGHLIIGPPTGISAHGFSIDNVGANGLGTLEAGGTSAPFLTAKLDLDALAIKAVPELKVLFHDQLHYDLGGFYVGADIDSNFTLEGSLSLVEKVSFTPQMYYTMTTSYGQTLTGQAGDHTVFQTPEGEGQLTVNATYTSEADLTTTISLHADIAFSMSLLKATLTAGIGEGPIDFNFGDINLPAAYQNTWTLAGVDIPIFSNTDHYVLDQVRTDTFSVSYENFRTLAGSGDSFALTTHQVSMDGNDDDNTFTGNALNNTLNGFGGNDTLIGADGNDFLDGGLGNDTLNGGSGDNVLTGDAGKDAITGGDGFNSIDGGAGDDVIVSGAGGSTIHGGAGDDKITVGNPLVASTSDNLVYGESGNDVIKGADIGDALFGGSGNDTINGLGGDDYIEGDAGNDKLSGAAGNDYLVGGAGKDVLTGGQGADTFVFNALSDSTKGSPDTITDFTSGMDKIDISGLDADTTQSGVQAFDVVFATTAAEGQVAVYQSGNITFLDFNVDADPAVEMRIELLNHPTLVTGDFVL